MYKPKTVPVYNIGKAWRYRSYRKVVTLKSLKLAQQVDPDEPKVRAKQGLRAIPNAWDDYPRHYQKCWKTATRRKKQWKG